MSYDKDGKFLGWDNPKEFLIGEVADCERALENIIIYAKSILKDHEWDKKNNTKYVNNFPFRNGFAFCDNHGHISDKVYFLAREVFTLMQKAGAVAAFNMLKEIRK